MKQYSDFEPFCKDQAYWERNQLVAALSKVYPSSLGKHPTSDKTWDKDWMNIVYICIPVQCMVYGDLRNYMDYRVEQKQLSWHLHKDDLVYFKHLQKAKIKWDGHTTDEKYERLKYLHVEQPKPRKWWQIWRKK